MHPARDFHFIVYGRAWCHLCETMLAALKAYNGAHEWLIEYIDIDTTAGFSPVLASRYDELVPVLTGARFGNGAGQDEAGTPQEICHYHLDPGALAAFLHENPGSRSQAR